jgi:hypothetical protein
MHDREQLRQTDQPQRRFVETPGYEGRPGPAGLTVRAAAPGRQQPRQPSAYRSDEEGEQWPPQQGADRGMTFEGPAPRQQSETALASAADAEATEPGVVVLSRDYLAHGDAIRRIRFRRPTANDLMKCGHPLNFVYDDVGKLVDVRFIYDIIGKYVVALGTGEHAGKSTPIPSATVQQFEIWDLEACAEVIGRFFVKRG